MKKLFSTMLAATMVAGMAVTAFAGTKAEGIKTKDSHDFGVMGAYDEDGNKIEGKKSKVDGGDKLYFPILVSGEELLDQKDNATDDKSDKITDDSQMYFATKASEVKNLKASVKDEIGGKYIDSAAIVKKDINITNDAKTATVVNSAKKASFDVTLTAVNVAIGTGTKDAKTTLEMKIGDGTVVSDEFDSQAEVKDATKVANLFAGKSITISGVKYDIKAEGAALKFTANTAGKATAVIDGTAPVFATKTTDTIVLTPETAKTANAVNGVDETTTKTGAIGKIYCVEVKMSDYFKAEETEVEFNIKLKDGGKTAFDTDDDKLEGGYFFNATFDLGKDTEILNASFKGKNPKTGLEVKKFKKGELEIKIGKDTRSVQLDEAIESDGTTKADVTNIYIENDKSIDNAFTFDVKASDQDDLYLELNQDAVKDLAVSNSRADLTFFNFPGKPEFDFTGKATFAVEDDDKDNYFYEIVDGELVESKAKYNKEDGVFELRTNKLGSYVISDKELKVSEGKKEENDTESKEQEGTGGDATADATTGANGEKGNANTGAADLIGVASALAVVSIAAAGAVALKK